MVNERAALRGSEKAQAPNSYVIGAPDASEFVTVTAVLRRRTPPEEASGPVTRENFAERFGADPADVELVEQLAADNDLTVQGIDLARRSVTLGGTVASMNEAFGTQLVLFQGPQGVYRGRTGVIYLPVELTEVVVGVFGLDERPQARAHFRRLLAGVVPLANAASFTPVQVASLYSYPAATGSGQTIALIELGGGFKAADLTAYFKQLGITPAPSVTAVSVDGTLNKPTGDPNGPDGEVLLDIEVAGAIAPKAKIAVYFAPNTDQGFLDAITTAVHDKVRKPTVVSISWGGAESTWTAQALNSFDQAFQDAALLGVTVCCASGDDGSADGVTDGAAHVDFPSSSPNVLACGGTLINASGGKITSEVVWNEGTGNGASGGGVSDHFPLPAYQAKAGVPVSVNTSHFKGRGVPDVSGNADPASGYSILVDGRSAVFGGTSAVAPLWAALVALINQQLGKPLGLFNASLYANAPGSKAFRDIVSGNNGAYKATAGWDACTGFGSPNGQQLLALLTPAPAAGHRSSATRKRK
jgi:kumamolisin